MKGKTKRINNLSKALLLAISFVLTIILTATITLAWFYDTDWASSTATMAGAVGIEMRDHATKVTSGADQMHFVITNTDLAYPGQSLDVAASVFNNGGSSIVNYFKDQNKDNSDANPDNNYSDTDIKNAGTALVGSACYIRAHFAVYTNIGTRQDDPSTPNINEADPESEKLLNARGLYEFLVGLIKAQNDAQTNYRWVYFNNPSPKKTLQGSVYYNGIEVTPENQDQINQEITTNSGDGGYFYLCKTDGYTLLPLAVGDNAAFLWKDTFIIPWQLTNASADRSIFVGVSFQAIQTFIPIISNAGVISTLANNRLDPNLCYYNENAVQTIFNTCEFEPIDTVIDGVDYSKAEDGFVKASYPSNPSGTIVPSTPE